MAMDESARQALPSNPSFAMEDSESFVLITVKCECLTEENVKVEVTPNSLFVSVKGQDEEEVVVINSIKFYAEVDFKTKIQSFFPNIMMIHLKKILAVKWAQLTDQPPAPPTLLSDPSNYECYDDEIQCNQLYLLFSNYF
jgi:hypothetical protein